MDSRTGEPIWVLKWADLDGAERMSSTLRPTGAGNSQKNHGPRGPPPRLLGPLCSASHGNRRMSICRGAQCTRRSAYTMAPRLHRAWHERARDLANKWFLCSECAFPNGIRFSETIAIPEDRVDKPGGHTTPTSWAGSAFRA